MIEPFVVPEQLHNAIQTAKKPLLFLDHPSGARYVMLPLEEYVAICMETVSDHLTTEEQQWLLVQAGLRAGWDNLEMDIYNDAVPQEDTRNQASDSSRGQI